MSKVLLCLTLYQSLVVFKMSFFVKSIRSHEYVEYYGTLRSIVRFFELVPLEIKYISVI